jgi:hypothetical protein
MTDIGEPGNLTDDHIREMHSILKELEEEEGGSPQLGRVLNILEEHYPLKKSEIKNVFDETDESEEDVQGVGKGDLSDPETFGHSVD